MKSKINSGVINIGFDIGTSSVKCLGLYRDSINSNSINTLFVHQKGYENHNSLKQLSISMDSSRNGFIEQDPNAWLQSFCYCLDKAADSISDMFGYDKNENENQIKVNSIALSGAMQQLIMVPNVQKDMRAILYSDTRSVAEYDEIMKKYPTLSSIVMNHHGPTALLPKLLWVKRHIPYQYNATKSIILGSHSFIVWMLTNNNFCDVTTASTTGLLLHRSGNGSRTWIGEDVFHKVGLDRECIKMLPSISSNAGKIKKSFFDEHLLLTSKARKVFANTNILHGSGDVGSVAFGAEFMQGKTKENRYLYLGTSGVMSKYSPIERNQTKNEKEAGFDDKNVFVLAHSKPKMDLIAASMTSCGLNVTHMSEILIGMKKWDVLLPEFDTLASMSPVGSNKLFYFPYLAGERPPLNSSSIRGSFVGLSIQHSREDMCRAILEGISFHIRWLDEVLGPTAIDNDDNNDDGKSLFVCGGGAKSQIWRQVLADVLGKKIKYAEMNKSVDVAALGAISQFMMECDSDSIKNMKYEFTLPTEESTKVYDKLYPIWKATILRLLPTFNDLQSI